MPSAETFEWSVKLVSTEKRRECGISFAVESDKCYERFASFLLENFKAKMKIRAGGGTLLLLALEIGPLTTHPFRDGMGG